MSAERDVVMTIRIRRDLYDKLQLACVVTGARTPADYVEKCTEECLQRDTRDVIVTKRNPEVDQPDLLKRKS